MAQDEYIYEQGVDARNAEEHGGKGFPTSAGICLGLGLGGFFDGIVLHQILQWHHMLSSAGFPPTDLSNLKYNTLWDGLFHAFTYIFVAIGLAILWIAASRPHVKWSGKMLTGTILLGFGIFNVVEGLIDHEILGIHHVNETVSPDQYFYWDIGFLVWGAVMVVLGWLIWREGKAETARLAEQTSRFESIETSQRGEKLIVR